MFELDTASSMSAIAPIEPDWKAIEERYLDGEEVQAIAADYAIKPGVISNRAWRNGWRARQCKQLEEKRAEIEKEVRGCLAVSCLKDARAFQREDPPTIPADRLTMIKARACLLETVTRLFGWERDDPVTRAKPARCIDLV